MCGLRLDDDATRCCHFHMEIIHLTSSASETEPAFLKRGAPQTTPVSVRFWSVGKCVKSEKRRTIEAEGFQLRKSIGQNQSNNQSGGNGWLVSRTAPCRARPLPCDRVISIASHSLPHSLAQSRATQVSTFVSEQHLLR